MYEKKSHELGLMADYTLKKEKKKTGNLSTAVETT